MVLNVKCGDATLFSSVSVSYQKVLNALSSFEIPVDSVDSTLRSELAVGNDVTIYKNGVADFTGKVKRRTTTGGGGAVIIGFGWEYELAKDPAPMSAAPDRERVWTSSNANTIFQNLTAGSSTGWSADVSNSTATSIDEFKVLRTETIWNAIIRLIKETGKDIYWDYSSRVLYLYDEKTSVSDTFYFKENINISEPIYDEDEPVASKVEVFGKGDGDSQFFGSAGSGVPVYTITDRTLISNTQCTSRATSELSKIQNNIKNIRFFVTNPNTTLTLGDSGKVNAQTAGLNETEVDIVKIRRSITRSGIETLDIEVTNPEYRIASKTGAEQLAIIRANNRDSETSMQGSGNENLFGQGINAKTGQSCKVPFYVSSKYVNQAGDINITGINVSYDIDPYNKQYGDASYDGSDPQVQNDSADNNAQVIGAIAETTTADLFPSEGSDSATGGAFGGGWDNSVCTVSVSGTYAFIAAKVTITDSGSGVTGLVRFRVQIDGTTEAIRWVPFDTSAGTLLADEIFLLPYFASSTDNIDLDIWTEDTSAYDCVLECWGVKGVHTHGKGTLSADDHLHSNGSYDVNAADLDDISIGDGIGEAAGLNASSVNLYLDFWNGSSWINKHSILATGKTIDQGVDISNSGQYPDAVGWWRVRVEPITAAADFAQGVVELINFMDN